MPVESPCVGICMLDDDERYCLGCRRTSEEIFSWELLSDAEKEAILERVKQRQTDAKNSNDTSSC